MHITHYTFYWNSSGGTHNLHNFTNKTLCSKYQGSSIYHILFNPLHIPARFLRSEEGIWLLQKNTQKTFDESHLFRCRCRMEQIAK